MITIHSFLQSETKVIPTNCFLSRSKRRSLKRASVSVTRHIGRGGTYKIIALAQADRVTWIGLKMISLTNILLRRNITDYDYQALGCTSARCLPEQDKSEPGGWSPDRQGPGMTSGRKDLTSLFGGQVLPPSGRPPPPTTRRRTELT